MTKEEINELLKLRDRHKCNIFATKDNPNHKNANIKRVIELCDLTKQLRSVGRRVSDDAEWLKYEYWNITEDVVNDVKKHPEKYTSDNKRIINKPIPNKPIPQPKTTISSSIVKNIQQPPKKSKYIISLAWTEDNIHDIKSTIDIIKEYFNDLNLKYIDAECFDKGNVVEYVSKYEWEGDDESFKILKYSAQFILDTISKNDYEKFNIAVYGKKKGV